MAIEKGMMGGVDIGTQQPAAQGTGNGNDLPPMIPGMQTATVGGAAPNIDPVQMQQAYQQPMNLGAAARTQLPDISTLRAMTVSQNQLSSEGVKYIEEIKLGLQSSERLKQMQKTVDVFQLTNINGAYVIAIDNLAMILIMYESAAKYGDAAVVTNTIFIAEEIEKQLGATYSIRDKIVVHKADYCRAANMISYIVNMFVGALRPEYQAMTMAMLEPQHNKGNYVVEFSFNSDDVHSPHGIAARKDLTLELKLRTDGGRQANTLNEITGGGVGRLAYSDELILSVGVYTTFIKTTAQNIDGTLAEKFLPIIHISDIYCSIPTKYAVPIAVGIVAHALLENPTQLWRKKFSDLTDKQVNIGELFPEPNGQAILASTAEDVELIFRNHMLSPYVVLDVPQGRATVPGIGSYVPLSNDTRDESVQAAIADMNRFFNTQAFTTPISKFIYSEDIGYSSLLGNMITDTREWDYLHCVHGRTSSPRLEELLSLMKESTNTIKILREVLDINTDSLYRNEWVIFSAEVLSSLSSLVAMSLNLPIMGTPERAMSPAFITAQANAYRSSLNNNTSAIQNSTNSLGSYYRHYY